MKVFLLYLALFGFLLAGLGVFLSKQQKKRTIEGEVLSIDPNNQNLVAVVATPNESVHLRFAPVHISYVLIGNKQIPYKAQDTTKWFSIGDTVKVLTVETSGSNRSVSEFLEVRH